MCLPETTREVLKSFNLLIQDNNILLQKLRTSSGEFNSNVKNVYAQFYGLMEETVLPLKVEDITYINVIYRKSLFS